MIDTPKRCYRLMLVDDEPNVLKALNRCIARIDYEIEFYQEPAEALRRAQTCVFDLVISDYRMPHMNGVEFLKELRELQPDCARLILSGYTDLNALLAAINEVQIYRFVSKPWQETELRLVIEQALAQRDLLRENRWLADQLREQRRLADRQSAELARLEAEHPGITRVRWTADGAIQMYEDEA